MAPRARARLRRVADSDVDAPARRQRARMEADLLDGRDRRAECRHAARRARQAALHAGRVQPRQAHAHAVALRTSESGGRMPGALAAAASNVSTLLRGARVQSADTQRQGPWRSVQQTASQSAAPTHCSSAAHHSAQLRSTGAGALQQACKRAPGSHIKTRESAVTGAPRPEEGRARAADVHGWAP